MLKLVVDKDEILRPLAKVQGIVDKKNIMSIINNVYVYTTDQELFIEATDLEISYRGNLPCKIYEQGALTVSASKIHDIIREFPSDKISITETEGNWIELSLSDNLLFRIAGLPPDEFPRFRRINLDNSASIQAQDLIRMISKVIFSASHEDHKFALSGVFTEVIRDEGSDGSILRMVTSDGHRLTLMDLHVPSENNTLDLDEGVIIPRKAAQEIRKVFSEDNEIRFGLDEDFCYVNGKTDQLVIRLVDGRFPDYKSIIPVVRKRFFSFEKSVVSGALKRLSILYADVLFKGVKASVRQGSAELESLNKEYGEGREVVPIDYQGEPFEIAFNAKYMLDALSVMDSETIRVTVNDNDSPCLVEGEQDPGFMALIMPMTILNDDESE